MVMFSKEEVANIRDLAAVAERENVPTKQLADLSKIALTRNLDELLLEIDIRDKARKLRRGFPGKLKEALMSLASTGEVGRDARKRATFIDYVLKLGRPQKTRSRQKGGRGKWRSKS